MDTPPQEMSLSIENSDINTITCCGRKTILDEDTLRTITTKIKSLRALQTELVKSPEKLNSNTSSNVVNISPVKSSQNSEFKRDEQRESARKRGVIKKIENQRRQR